MITEKHPSDEWIEKLAEEKAKQVVVDPHGRLYIDIYESFLEALYALRDNLSQTECELVLPKEKELRAGAASLATEIGNYNRVQRAVLDAIKKLNTHLKTRVEGE